MEAGAPADFDAAEAAIGDEKTLEPISDTGLWDAPELDARDAGSDLDAVVEGSGGPTCPIKITDLTYLFGDRVTGRVAASGGLNPYTKVVTEQIGARTPRDHLVMYERVAGSWTKTDVSALSATNPNPRVGNERCTLTTVVELGAHGQSKDGSNFFIQTWTALSPAAELLLYLQYNDGPWNDCLSVSNDAHQLVRSAPEGLTDGSAVAIGPDHDALVFRWGGIPPGGDDWQVRARLGSGFVGGFTAWNYDDMHSFAGIRDDGSVAVFRSTMLDVWKEDATEPAGPRIVDVPLGWTSLHAENLAATSEERHLVFFSHRAGERWQFTDVTALDGETAVGRPTRYELPSSFDTEEVLIARNVAGHLIYHFRDRNLKWHAYDMSRETQMETPIMADPSAWAVPAPAVAAQGSDGRLLVFDGLECLRSLPVRLP
jgi:hypothetical protein